jgi:hypothetical protein
LPDSKKSSWRISSKKLSNLKVVVFCILAATTFWILNALNKDNYSTIVDYPIEWEFDTEKFYPVKALPNTVQIQISGNGWDLLRKYFNLNEPAYRINLADPSEMEHILTSNLKRPLGEFLTPTQLIGFLEDTIDFKIDRIETKSVKPYLDSASYSLAKNAIIEGPIVLEPKELKITGPASVVKSFEGKFPIYLNQNRIDQDFSLEIPLTLENELAETIRLNTNKVRVSFTVVQFMEGNKRLKIKKLNFPKSVTLENENITAVMTYLVDERRINELKEIEFEAILDYGKRNRADSTISVRVQPTPEFIKDIKVSPEFIKLKYE